MADRRTLLIASLSGLASALLVAVLVGFNDPAPTAEENAEYARVIQDRYRIFSLPLPETASFAGEVVPLDQWDVRERLDRELLVNTYWQSNTLLTIKRANRWFPVIEPILAANGIPDDFKYLALIESGLVNVVSPSGATGFWQFLDGTGKEYGLEINEEVDERYHVQRSTEAACHYFRDAYDRFGNWTMVAASYNMGMNGIDKQVARQQRTNYWDLLLNEETARYVLRIVAVKEILSRPDQYGFVLRPADLYPPLHTTTVTLDTAVDDFAVYASTLGISYKTLKLYNPWLRQSYLKNKEKKSYTLFVPVDGQ